MLGLRLPHVTLAEPDRSVILQHTNRKPERISACLRCQLVGHPKLICSTHERCRTPGHGHTLGLSLLIGWVVVAAAFFLGVT